MPEGASRSVNVGTTTNNRKHIMEILSTITVEAGEIKAGIVAGVAALGVALIGMKAVESVGRNPGASGKILVQSILGMALAEGLGLIALFV